MDGYRRCSIVAADILYITIFAKILAIEGRKKIKMV